MNRILWRILTSATAASMSSFGLLMSRSCWFLILFLFTSSSHAGGWTSAGNLSIPRPFAVAARLANGGVLVAGGGFPPSAGAEIYKPESNTWHSASPMIGARELATATLLTNGAVLVAGGHNNSVIANAFPSAQIYDPLSDAWTVVGDMHSPRWSHTATRLLDGRVLVTGGVADELGYLSEAEIYDPLTSSWTPVPSMSKSRASHSATLLPGGKVLVAGGTNSSAIGLADAEIYDPAANTWISASAMTVNRAQHSATLLPNGKVLIVGGGNDVALNSAEIYDPTTNSWTSTNPLRDERQFHSATLLKDGTVLVVGGVGDTFGSFITYLSTSELYHLSTGTWTDAGKIATANPFPIGTLLESGKVLLIGYTTTTNVELYTPAYSLTESPVASVPAIGAVELVTLAAVIAGISCLLRRREK